MTYPTSKLRSLFVALAALVLTVGVVAAGGPSAEGLRGLDRAAEVTGKAVPVKVGQAPSEETVAEETVAEDATTTTKEHPENHGKYVSEAARGATPDGWDNHGAYVRSIAQSDMGKPGATAEPPTAAGTDATAKTKKAKPAHAHGHGGTR